MEGERGDSAPEVDPLAEQKTLEIGVREEERAKNCIKLRDATQAGEFGRCKLIIETGVGVDVNAVDHDGVTSLHWAAIGGLLAIAKLLISHGANVNCQGGVLNSTPLQWSIRGNRFKMVDYLIANGADVTIQDVNGCEAIHLAAKHGSMGLCAYFLAKGIDPNRPDGRGNTPLMWACTRVAELGMIRLLLSFGVDTSVQDEADKNTALHRAIEYKNWYGVDSLLQKGISVNIPNKYGLTGKANLEQKIESKEIPHYMTNKLQRSLKETCNPYSITIRCMKLNLATVLKWIVPLFVFGLGAIVLELDIHWGFKVGIIAALVLTILVDQRNVPCIHVIEKHCLPISVATKVLIYVAWFLRIAPVIDPWFTHVLLSVSFILWYNFLKGWLGDPGVIKPCLDERLKRISELGEENAFNNIHFCATCIIRRPKRSKHCSTCKRCVARMDHHCLFLSNCVGVNNHLNFILYIICMIVNGLVFLTGCILYWKSSFVEPGFKNFCLVVFTQSPLVSTLFPMVVFHVTWISYLLITQLYQILWLGMTTNENINQSRYGYLRSQDTEGESVFNRGICGNLCDFLGLGLSPCCACYERVDWFKVYWPIIGSRDPTTSTLNSEPDPDQVVIEPVKRAEPGPFNDPNPYQPRPKSMFVSDDFDYGSDADFYV